MKESNIEVGMLRYLIDLIDPQEFQQYPPQYPQQQYFGQCYQKSCNTCNTELKLDGDTIYCPSCTNWWYIKTNYLKTFKKHYKIQYIINKYMFI